MASSRLRRAPGSLAAALLACLLAAVGCAPDGRTPAKLGVWGPASLVDALPAVAARWRRQGGMPATFSFDATSTMARQVAHGAPADVFVAADRRWMRFVEDRHHVEPATRVEFLSNRLVVIAPAKGPGPQWHSLADLARQPPERLVLGGEGVPVGRYAEASLRAAHVWDVLASRVVRAEHARAALEWVAQGDAGAGVVYRTDAMAEPRVRVAFEVPDALHAPIVYSAAVVRGAPHRREAARFVRFLGSASARAVFEKAGFVPTGSGS